MKKKLLVTGTGRCGTGFMAALLNELGLKAGHEAVFSPLAKVPLAWEDYDADCSWLAVPFGPFGEFCHVMELRRHPWKIIRSLVGIGFFRDGTERHEPYLSYALAHVRANGLRAHENRAAAWVLEWVKLVDDLKPDSVVQVENPAHVLDVLKCLGHEVDLDAWTDLMFRVPDDVNTRPHRYPLKPYTMNRDLVKAVNRLCIRWGYDPAEVFDAT